MSNWKLPLLWFLTLVMLNLAQKKLQATASLFLVEVTIG
jgi:hypothetical protein